MPSQVGGDAPPPPDGAVSPAACDAKDGGTRGASGRAGAPASAHQCRRLLASICQLCCCLPCRQPLRSGLLLLSTGNVLKHAVFFFYGLGFSFCLSKAENKACAIMAFVSVSALHPQQWLLKFGRGYMSERYIHFCTFHESK